MLLESKDFDQYLVKIHGSGRITLRNRKFLRLFCQPLIVTTSSSFRLPPLPISSAPVTPSSLTCPAYPASIPLLSPPGAQRPPSEVTHVVTSPQYFPRSPADSAAQEMEHSLPPDTPFYSPCGDNLIMPPIVSPADLTSPVPASAATSPSPCPQHLPPAVVPPTPHSRPHRLRKPNSLFCSKEWDLSSYS